MPVPSGWKESGSTCLQKMIYGIYTWLPWIFFGTPESRWKVRLHAKYMSDNGCVVDNETNIVKIPAHLVEDALISIPKTFRACGRDPEKDWICERNRTGFVNFGEAVQMIDPYTREIRKANRKDVDDVTRICDYLDQIVVYERAIAPSEVDPDVASGAYRGIIL